MFKSPAKVPASNDNATLADCTICIPQSQHAMLAGVIAQHWGNEEFDRPTLPFQSFLDGLARHDEAHGFLDNNLIGGMELDHDYEVAEAMVEHDLEDPVADLVSKFHIRRLLQNTAKHPDLSQQVEQAINKCIGSTNHSVAEFMWADYITNVCDYISFNFCFGRSETHTVSVCPDNQSAVAIDMSFTTAFEENTGVVTISPWPLKVPKLEGYIMGFEESNYPDNLRAVLRYYILVAHEKTG